MGSNRQSTGRRANLVLGGVFLISAAMAFQCSAEARSNAPVTIAEPPTLVYDTERPDLAALIQKVKPAVVSIGVDKRVVPTNHAGSGTPFGVPNDFFRFFGQPQGPRGPQGDAPKAKGQGSGFVIAADGYIVTNQHVIDGADKITVIFEDGSQLAGELIGSDAKTDLAVVKVNSDEALPFVQFGDSDQTQVGDWVVAIGNPFGFGGTATAGIISARGRDLASASYVDFLQIDAPINSGNSGGPIFDDRGQVIGVNTAIYSPNGGNVGLGFAIPSADAVEIINTLKVDGRVAHGWLGVQIQNMDKELAKSLGLDKASGALIVDVVAGSPAARAGLEVGDVIQRFDGSDVSNAKDLTRLVARANLDRSAKIDVLREGSAKALKVRITPSDDSPQIATSEAAKSGLGLSVAPLNADDRQALGLDPEVKGVVVTEVVPNTEAAAKGIRRGDVISRVNQRNIDSVKDVRSALKAEKQANKNSVALLVRRGDSKRFLSLSLA